MVASIKGFQNNKILLNSTNIIRDFLKICKKMREMNITINIT